PTARGPPKTLCPSEVARALNSQDLQSVGLSSWRDTMREVRIVAAELRVRGDVEILQKGLVLAGDLGEQLELVKGSIRIRMTA
ncbi:hypothetical protein B0J14DRAFT_480138, partial [Halenospora varia]